jgi:hypothetical protein
MFVAQRMMTHELSLSISDDNASSVLPSASSFSIRHRASPRLVRIVSILVTFGRWRTGMIGVVGWSM